MEKQEMEKLINHGEDVMLVDIREPEEYSDGLSAGKCINIPMGKMFTEAGKGNLPKDKKIILVCKSGGRCKVVTQELKERGYDIDYLEGGVSSLS